jgi:GNAT superfamily N-acetyltransferase
MMLMSTISIRTARKSDAASLARIWVENCRYYAEMDPESFQVPNEDGLVEWFESFLEESPKENELNLVGELDGEVVGSLEGRIEQPIETADRQMLRELGEPRLFVNAMGVDPAHWRSGVGTALMRAAEVWAKERGATRSGLDTYMDSPVSVPFYEKLGYRRHSINFRKRL